VSQGDRSRLHAIVRFSPLIAPSDQVIVGDTWAPPSAKYWLGLGELRLTC